LPFKTPVNPGFFCLRNIKPFRSKRLRFVKTDQLKEFLFFEAGAGGSIYFPDTIGSGNSWYAFFDLA